MAPRIYNVDPRGRGPLVDFMVAALEASGCRVIYRPPPDKAPYQITFEDPEGQRQGIIAYAFTANTRVTRNRPGDEHRFQLKYGSKDGNLHELWQDSTGLYTTLLVGINTEQGFFVGADPVLHSPTRLFISIEFKQEHVDRIAKDGWFAWERIRRTATAEPLEVLVGGRPEHFLRYVRFERAAFGEDQGHRKMLADDAGSGLRLPEIIAPGAAGIVPPAAATMHALVKEFQMTEGEVLDLIQATPRLGMAVWGSVAEVHLERLLAQVPGVTDCARLTGEGKQDVSLRFEGSRPLTVECKNVSRDLTRSGLVKMDFMRTRHSKNDECSRFYGARDFDLVAACLHPVSRDWYFKFSLTSSLDPHPKSMCASIGKLSNNVRIDDRWSCDPREALRAAARSG